MRKIKWTRQFKRDHRRIKATPRYRDIDSLLGHLTELLANDQPLPPERFDHALVGRWMGFRECHVQPDLLLIYDKPTSDVLLMVRLGSHSELRLG